MTAIPKGAQKAPANTGHQRIRSLVPEGRRKHKIPHHGVRGQITLISDKGTCEKRGTHYKSKGYTVTIKRWKPKES